MENKYNEATINRPEGSRMIDGPCIFTDLVAVSEQLRKEKAWETNDLNGITVVKTDTLAIVLTIIKEGTRIKKNQVESPFTLMVLNGKLAVETDEKSYKLETGNMLNFHPGISHDIIADKETVLLQMTSS